MSDRHVHPAALFGHQPAVPGGSSHAAAQAGWEIRDILVRQSHREPRSVQRDPGPSELGVVCLQGETEVVTRQGIREIRDLAKEGSAELLIPMLYEGSDVRKKWGRFTEVPVESFGEQELYEITLHRGQDSKTVFATADHHWFRSYWSGKQRAQKRLATTDLRPGYRLTQLRRAMPRSTTMMPVAVAQGFTFGDGAKGSDDDKHRPAILDLFHNGKAEALLPFFPGEHKVYRKADSVYAYSRVRGLPRFWKQLPSVDESVSFLMSWLAGYFAADGSVTEDGHCKIDSAYRENLEFVRDAAAVCGIGYGQIQTIMRRGACGTENGKVRLTEHETPLYRLSLRRRDLPDWFFLIEKHARRIRAVSRAPELDPHWIVESVRATGRTELVYCAITGDAGAFALADDLMTGNCDRQVVAKMAGEMPTGHTADPWPSIVGLALDAWLKRYFANENRLAGYDRWLTDIRVRPHPSYPGTLDLYDTVTFNVIDLKGLYIHTPVPVPGGWTAIGDLQPGDKVFGSDGRPCTVTRTYPVQHRDCFRVTFDDGAELIADDRQLWAVDAGPQAQWKLLLSTVQAADSIWSRTARPQRHLRIPVSGALELPEADLPVHPYVLGCWLGDGGCYGGVISKPDDELFDNIRDCGYRVSPPLGRRGLTRTVYGLTTQLRVAGLLWVNEERRGKSHQQLTGQKLIPPAYLRASFTQRLALLRGLMDTDGTWNRPRKRAVFTTTDKQLAADTAELIRSLGWKAHIGPYTATGFGLTVTAYNVEFTPAGGNPFWLLRKADLVRTEGSARSGHRIIRSIESCLSVPTRCIDVDSPDRLFLAGPEMIPVHNCQGASTAAKLRSGGPSPRYFNQVRLYAWGMRLAGYRVDRVSIVSLPRTKSFLSEIYVWDHVLTEADDLAVIELLRRTEARRHAAQLVLSRQLPIGQVQRTPDGEECHFCDYFRVEAAHDGGPGCPGDRAPVTYPYPRAAPAA